MPTNKRKSLEDLTPITDGSDAIYNNPIIKVIDPTGVTSYQDTYNSYTQPSSLYDRITNTLSSIPAVGKIGKVLNFLGNIGGFVNDAKKYYSTQAHNHEALYYTEDIYGNGTLAPRKSMSATQQRHSYPATQAEIRYYINNAKDSSRLKYTRPKKK